MNEAEQFKSCQDATMEKKTYLIVAPEALIAPHFETMVRIGIALQSVGRVVLYGCDSRLTRCVYRDSDTKAEHFHSKPIPVDACDGCRFRFSKYANSLGFKTVIPDNAGVVVEEGLGTNNHNFNPVIAAASSLILRSTPEAADNTHPGIIRSWSLTFQQIFLNTIAVLRKYEVNVLLVHSQYLQSMAAFMAAKSIGVNAFLVDNPHFGLPDYNRANLRKAPWREAIVAARDRFFRPDHTLHLDSLGRNLVSRHLASLVGKSSPWVYSPKSTGMDVFEALDIPRDKKILGIFTSSPDELNASTELAAALRIVDQSFTPFRNEFVFEDQFQWLRWLNSWKIQHDGVVCVVRVHPRLGKKSGIESPDNKFFSDARSQLRNLVFVDADSDLSSYDLLSECSGVTTVWSSMALEANYFGLPSTVAAKKTPTYPTSGLSILHSTTSEEYGLNLVRMLEEGSDRQTTIDCCLRSWSFLAFSKKVQFGVALPNLADSPLSPVLNDKFAAEFLRYADAINSDKVVYPMRKEDSAKEPPPEWFFQKVIESLLRFERLPLVNKLINLTR